MKLTNTLLALLIAMTSNLWAQTKQQVVTSTIEKVTVFTSGAQVFRKVKKTLPQGKTELVFSGISPNIDKQSIQVKGEGNFTILSVIHQTNYLNEQKRRQETALLEIQKQNLNNRIKADKSLLAVFKNEESMLLKNQEIKGSNTGIKTSDLKEAVDFHRSRLSEVLLKQLEIEANIQQSDSIIRKIEQQLKALNQPKDFATSEVLVTVSAKESTSASFELSYFVRDAGWFANYDLRVKDIANPIDLTFKANIFQTSGEDWRDIKLTISNGNPTESGVAPSLQVWNLRFGYPQNDITRALQGRAAGITTSGNKGNEVSGKITDKATGEAIPGVTILLKGTTIGTYTDINGNYSLKIPASAQTLIISFIGYETQEVLINAAVINVALSEDTRLLQEVVVTGYGISGSPKKEKSKRESSSIPLETTETYQPTTLTFDIEMPYTILNDGKVYTVDIKNQTVPAQYEYFAVPKLGKDAYLTAKITDWQELNLLEGEVSLFFEGSFLGKSVLDLQSAGDTLDISLGKDKNIVIERKKLKEFSSKQFLSSYKTESRAYEISVRNNKSQSIKITVQDQFPVSTTKEISVDEQEYKDAKLDNDTKILTWKYEIAPRQEKKHTFRYSVKYPKNQVVVLD